MFPWDTPLGVACVALALLLTWLGWAPVTRWKLRRIPGPWALPFLGHLPAIAAKDITYFLFEVAQKYGPVAKVWLGARPWVVVSDPAAIRKVAYKSVNRPASSSSFSHMLVGEPQVVDAESDLWNRGAAWKASRRAFESVIMHPDRLAAHLPAARRCAARFVESLSALAASGEGVEMKRMCGVVALAIVGEVAYGVDFWPEDGGAYGMHAGGKDTAHGGGGRSGGGGGHHASPSPSSSSAPGPASQLIAACYESLECLQLPNATGYLPLQMLLPSLRPLWLWLAQHLPDPAQRRHMAARQKVADVSRQLMAQWQAARGAAPAGGGGDAGFRDVGGGISGSSFLAGMLEDRRRGGAGGDAERMSDLQVISQGLTFILAGYDTTASSLSILTYLLATHPAVQDKLRGELASHPGALGSWEELSKLPYLDAVLKESQRLHPVGTFGWRDVTSDVDVGGGTVIPKGSFVCLSYYNILRDPAQWPHPDRFLPERFLADCGPGTDGASGGGGGFSSSSVLGPADPAAFMPFGCGPRMCVGHKLAHLMIKTLLSALVLRYRIQLHPRQPPHLTLKTGLVLAPAEGVWVTLQELA